VLRIDIKEQAFARQSRALSLLRQRGQRFNLAQRGKDLMSSEYYEQG
jgi:hypothetical protein